ncbi:MAG: 5-formyltetrahydrofolate cyclo-ligase [Gammaproteobacteria bacterium]|mgnify:FL=1|nr:5-formyltetrahydrofolate cyclo-ligase [Gammaproteobacteria bacterium]|tara:strand:- start:4423 stop:5004 length:582 start_codon:yes stop_codon:yes gene_type:complete
MNDKLTLRRKTILKRDNLSKESRVNSEISLGLMWDEVKSKFKHKRAALYWPVNNEISTKSLIKNLLTERSECYLPVVSEDKDNKYMEFKYFTKKNKFTRNRFSIPEPVETKKININELDIIFMPCVCFDLNGNRIGMGQGFYDKTLEGLYKSSSTKLLILAYEFQEVMSCFPEAHDIKADACLTPNKLHNFEN